MILAVVPAKTGGNGVPEKKSAMEKGDRTWI